MDPTVGFCARREVEADVVARREQAGVSVAAEISSDSGSEWQFSCFDSFLPNGYT